MHLQPASDLSLEELTALWNRAYSGYFVPLHFSTAQLADHLRCGDIDLARSAVARLDGEPVGISLLGVRGERGWIGGFGVVPEQRGRGLAHRLFAAQMQEIRARGPARVQLEVLTPNWARKVYERESFVTTRRLSILRGHLPERSTGAGSRAADPRELLAHHGRLHGGRAPAWNREAAWLEKSLREGDTALFVGPRERPSGLLFLRDAPTGPRVLDAAAEEGAADALLAAVAAAHPGREVTLVNEPEASPLHGALLAAGFTEALAQYEMHWRREGEGEGES